MIKKVIQRFQESEEHYFLSESMKEELARLLDENHIESDNAKVMYSLGYSQGDGAMFSGDCVWRGCDITVKHSGRYYHYNSKTINYNDEVEPTTEEQQKEFEELYVEICQKLAKWGYSCIESDLEESNIIENIKANEYTFTIGGRIESI